MKVSVVTISFNQHRFLPEAIGSVRVTNGNELQYVVVDPGSTDGSREIIEQNRDRFAEVVFDKDDGPADGLNRGFALCDGDIFGYLNADDHYVPGALDEAAKFFEEHPEADVLFGSIAIIDESGHRFFRKRVPDRFDVRKYAEMVCNVWCPSTFFRRKAFEQCGGFNPQNRTCWDGELAVDLALSGAELGYTNRVLGAFRVYPESITGSRRLRDASVEDRRRIREKIYGTGLPRYSPMAVRASHLQYKFNVLRQLRYILAR